MERPTDIELAELARRARAGDVAARNAIVEANLGIAGVWAKGDPDRFQGAVVGLIHAASKYDPAYGAFGTYAKFYLRRDIDRDGPIEPTAAEPLYDAPHPIAGGGHAVEVADLVEYLMGFVDDAQRAILRLRYGGTFRTQKAVAEIVGIRRQLVQDAEAAAVERMREVARADQEIWSALRELVA